jgi:hypothetical protein
MTIEMKKLFKIMIILIAIVIIVVGSHIFYLFYLCPSEDYSEDTYLTNEKNKTALIVVAHDDDALMFCGTTTKLIAQGWEINFLCFYNSFYHPKDTPVRKMEVEEISKIEGIKNIDLIDFNLRKKYDTIAKGWWPVPYNQFSEYFKEDSLST